MEVLEQTAQLFAGEDLAIDSCGLSIFGEDHWAADKHGGNGILGWWKPHIPHAYRSMSGRSTGVGGKPGRLAPR